MFESVIEKFDKYWDKTDAENPKNFNQDLASEVRKRLEQLDYFYKLIMDKNEKYFELHRIVFSKKLKDNLERKNQAARGFEYTVTRLETEEDFQINKLLLETETFAESFYYLAFRTRGILRNSIFPFPMLKKFECEGVNIVRNKLIEHPEEQGKVLIQNFGLDAEQGPISKPDRPEGQEDIFPDAGLKTNALEFTNNLEMKLDNALA